ELFEHLDGMIVARGTQVVGQFAAGKIGITAADEDQIPGEASVLVEDSSGFDGGARTVVGADQGQSGGGGKQLGVGSGGEQLVRILGIQEFSVVEGDYLDAPESAGEVGGGKDRVNALGDGIMRGGVELRGQQQAKNNREMRALSGHLSQVDCSTGLRRLSLWLRSANALTTKDTKVHKGKPRGADILP